jgi:uncharacterized integral membrane protein
MRIIQYLTLILLVVLTTLFAVGNPQRVELRFFPLETVAEMRLFILVPALLLLGFIFGRLFTLISLMGVRHRLKTTQQHLAKVSEELVLLKKERGDIVHPPI